MIDGEVCCGLLGLLRGTRRGDGEMDQMDQMDGCKWIGDVLGV